MIVFMWVTPLWRGLVFICIVCHLQDLRPPGFRIWELVVIAVDGAAILLLLAMAGVACTAVVHWRWRQQKRLLKAGQFQDDEVHAEHARGGVFGPILYKDIVMAELIGRGTFTLVHRAHLGYLEVAIKTLKGRCKYCNVLLAQTRICDNSPCTDNHSELGRFELLTELERYQMTELRVCMLL